MAKAMGSEMRGGSDQSPPKAGSSSRVAVQEETEKGDYAKSKFRFEAERLWGTHG
jgi:hypothetical protein